MSVDSLLSEFDQIRNILSGLDGRAKFHGGDREDFVHLLDDDARMDAAARVIVGVAEAVDLSPDLVSRTAYNPNVRMKALEQVRDQEVLFFITTSDPVARIRETARAMLTDQILIAKALIEGFNGKQEDRSDEVRRLDDQRLLIKIIIEQRVQRVRFSAVNRLNELGLQAGLAEVVIDEKQQLERNPSICERALASIADIDLLDRIFKTATSAEIRKLTLKKTEVDQDHRAQLLIELEESDPVFIDFAYNLLEELDPFGEQAISRLKRIALKAKSTEISCEALRRYLVARGKPINSVSEDKLRQWRFEQIHAEAGDDDE